MQIQVSHPSMTESARTAVRILSNGRLAAPLGLPTRGPFGLARVSVHISGEKRALHQCRFWYWPGFKGVQGPVFDAVSIPDNLAERDLVHINRGVDSRLSLDTGRPYLRAQLAFDVDNLLVSFGFPPPGVSMVVRNSAGQESPLGVGSRLRFGQDEFASHLIVRCPEPSVTLDIRGQIISHPFDKFGFCRIPFGTLSSGGEHRELRLSFNSGGTIVLLRVESAIGGQTVGLRDADNGSSGWSQSLRKRSRLRKRRHGRGRIRKVNK